MNGSARDETVLRYRGRLWWRLPVVLLATGMIGYLTIAVFVADRLTVPVRRQVPRAGTDGDMEPIRNVHLEWIFKMLHSHPG
ncbi:MAG: hypothetical protein NVS4B8_27110 [Herpetosiphon sp.]